MTEEVKPTNIHEAIAAIMQEVGYVQKTRNQNLNYSFAGETALIEAIRPFMVKYGVYMYVADVSDMQHEFYTTDKGKTMVNTTLKVIIRFAHAATGTHIDVASAGEGSDTGDKSQNKALTGAYKYALRQTFCIATGDDPDNESSDNMARKAGAKSNGNNAFKHSQKELLAYAKQKGLDAQAVGVALGKAGFTEIDLSRWDELVGAVDAAA